MKWILELIDKWVKAIKNFIKLWQALVGLVGLVGAGMTAYITKLDTMTGVYCGIISVLTIVLISIAIPYRQLKTRLKIKDVSCRQLKAKLKTKDVSCQQLKTKWKKITHSLDFIHNLTHNLREHVGKQCQLKWDETWTSEVIDNHLKMTVGRILDDGANCLTNLTGEKIISCLLIPVGIQKVTHSPMFETIEYGGNPSNSRCNGSKTHERGIIQQAFQANRAIIHYDYEKEFKQGIFIPARHDWQDFYMSSMMARFSIKGTPAWGVLSFDCLKKNAFEKDWQSLTCVFSDALGLVLSLQNPYRQWSVS